MSNEDKCDRCGHDRELHDDACYCGCLYYRARSTPGTAAGGDGEALIDAMLESVQCIDVSRRDMRDVLRVVRAWPAPATPATKDAK